MKDMLHGVLPKCDAPLMLQWPVLIINSISKAALFSKFWGILNAPGENCSGEFEVNKKGEGEERRRNEKKGKKKKEKRKKKK